AMLPMWDDLSTSPAQCPSNLNCGIYTSVSGSEPNRIFNIEWRTGFFGRPGTADFEVRLYEGQNRFDFVYGQVSDGGASATIGVQRGANGGGTGAFTQYSCNIASAGQGLRLTFTLQPCGTPTNTPTPCPDCPTST